MGDRETGPGIYDRLRKQILSQVEVDLPQVNNNQREPGDG